VAGENRRRPGSVWQLLGAFLVASLVAGVLAGGLTLPAAAVLGTGVNAGSKLVSASADLADPALEQTTVMTAADGSTVATFYNENRTPVPLTGISPRMQQAVIAVEDSRFYEHGAVDARGVLRALVNNETGGDTQGASTITQQYVKNALLEQATYAGNKAAIEASTADTIERKLRDIRIAAGLEKRLSKQQILERYLNIVYFGDQTYGVEAAAQRYFGTTAADLSIAQAATLAGMVQNANRFNPADHPKAAKQRRDVVLRLMFQQRIITQSQYEKAVATRIKVTGEVLPNGCANAKHSYGYFCQYVVQSIVEGDYPALGRTSALRARAVQQGGLKIVTSLDRVTQRAAVESVDSHIPRKDSSGLGTAAVTVEPGTGKVLAMAQNRTYSVTGGRGRTSINYAVDQDLGGATGFQTGSSFKAFTLADWLAQGRSLNETVDATPRSFAFSDFSACGQTLRGTQPYAPGNAEGHETGSISVEKATADSVNVAYVEMESKLDLCDIADTAQKLGVHLASPAQHCDLSRPRMTRLPTCLPSLTLGVLNVAPLTMAAAYAGFASGGTYCTPVPVTSITRTGPDGDRTQSLKVPGTACSTALPPEVAGGVNAALKQVLTNGTAAGVGGVPGHESAGKTGTTNGPYDTWFVGYTAQRSTAVWVGDPAAEGEGRKALRGIAVGGRYYGTIYGATIAAPIWKDVMIAANRDVTPEALP
jgi:membrane peptidoglycan carboxypeptidase